MAAYLLRRVLLLVPVWLAVYTLTFGLMQLTPGGPWDREKPVPREVREALDRKYGLDKPMWQQYTDYLVGVVTRFDFGPSYKQTSRTVTSVTFSLMPKKQPRGKPWTCASEPRAVTRKRPSADRARALPECGTRSSSLPVATPPTARA